MYDEVDDLFPENSDKVKRRKELLSQLNEMEEESDSFNKEVEESSFLPSSFFDGKLSGKKKKKEKSMDDWMDICENLKMKKPSRKGGKKNSDPFFLESGGKKKKKKKEKKQQEVDYRKEFEVEAALYKNLLQDQTRFTDSLQKEYDAIRSTKSSSRGVTKTLTELIQQITSARSLSMQLVEKNVNVKKLIADLSLKQKKELGLLSGDAENLGEFASSYLKQMMDERKNIVNGSSDDTEIIDYGEDDDELSSFLNEQLGETDRTEAAQKQLEYENLNVKIYAVIYNDNAEDYDFVAYDDNNEIIDDYPVPVKTSLSINRSTGVATDTYGRKYFIKWENK